MSTITPPSGGLAAQVGPFGGGEPGEHAVADVQLEGVGQALGPDATAGADLPGGGVIRSSAVVFAFGEEHGVGLTFAGGLAHPVEVHGTTTVGISTPAAAREAGDGGACRRPSRCHWPDGSA